MDISRAGAIALGGAVCFASLTPIAPVSSIGVGIVLGSAPGDVYIMVRDAARDDYHTDAYRVDLTEVVPLVSASTNATGHVGPLALTD